MTIRRLGLTINELARELDKLKNIRGAAALNSDLRDEVRNKRILLEDQLEPLGLGIAWQDSEECFMVYSFRSIKE